MTFNAAKLKVKFAGEDKQPPPFPRAYTLTHCDFTANRERAHDQRAAAQLAVRRCRGTTWWQSGRR